MSTRNEQNVHFWNIYCIMKFEGLKINILKYFISYFNKETWNFYLGHLGQIFFNLGQAWMACVVEYPPACMYLIFWMNFKKL